MGRRGESERARVGERGSERGSESERESARECERARERDSDSNRPARFSIYKHCVQALCS